MQPFPINIHTHARPPGETAVVSHRLGIGEPLPESPFSAGIHPWDAAEVDVASCLNELRRLPAAAVGEAGLDKLRGPALPVQEKILRRQLDIAAERRLPVIIHCVRAYNELLETIKGYPGLRFIVHGFTGSPQTAGRITAAGGFLSFGFGFPRSPKTAESLRTTPADRLFFESDTCTGPVTQVYEKAAAVRGETYESLVERVYCNYIEIFGLNGMEQPYRTAVRA